MEDIKMDFDEIILNILNDFTEGKPVDIDEYCKRYPQYREAILAKFKTANFLKNHFQEEDFSNKKLGDYILLQELGRGGMGIVFLAIQPALSRLSAIKVLPPSFSYDKEALNNFKEEAKTIAQFNHPNIVPIFSIGEERGIYYIAMSYIPGLSLKNIIEMFSKNQGKMQDIKAANIRNILQEPLSNKQEATENSITLRRKPTFWNINYFQFIASIISEVADALNYAHENKIVHGDLKPSNILLTREAIPMVVDFGLSSKPGKGAVKNEFSGTIMYAAPEQIKNNTINEKTDIWALGVTLYELLCFHNPFSAETLQKTSDNILKGYPDSPRKYNKKTPQELESIVLKCLENDPDKRYKSMRELSSDLNNYLELKPIIAKSEGGIKILRKSMARNRSITIFSSIILLLLLIMLSDLPRFATYNYFADIPDLLKNGHLESAMFKYDLLNKYKSFYPLSTSISARDIVRFNYDIASYYLDKKDSKSTYYFQKVISDDPNNAYRWSDMSAKAIATEYIKNKQYDKARKMLAAIYNMQNQLQMDIDFTDLLFAYTYQEEGLKLQNTNTIENDLAVLGLNPAQRFEIIESFRILLILSNNMPNYLARKSIIIKKAGMAGGGKK